MSLSPELTSPVEVADAAGRLRPEALGWARHPLQRCVFAPGVSRVERFHYWCVTSREAALTLLVADVGIAGVALVSFLELGGGRPVERVHVRPGGLGAPLPDGPRGDVAIDARRLRLVLRHRGDEMVVEGDARPLLGGRIEIDLVVSRPAAHETVNVVVPWDETRFHFTSKQQALPARGVVRVAGREHRFGPENEGFACLDFGRGRWPRAIDWGWAFASWRRAGRTFGLNLGSRWTDGTGVTENGFTVDGRLHKIGDAVDFDTGGRVWTVRARAGGRVDLRFEPLRRRVVRVPLGLVSADLVQQMGAFHGALVDDAGERIAVEGAVGLAETFRGRW